MALDDRIKEAFQAVGGDVKTLLSGRIASATVASIWSGTQAQYDSITTKSPTTLYFITDSEMVEGPDPEVGGKSAYQIAVDQGFVGTEAEWLSSLEGVSPPYPNFTASAETLSASSPVAASVSGTYPDLDILLGIPASRTIYGAGSPLGVIAAPPGTKYIDEAGTLGAWEWLKKSGTGTSGWEVIHGDTGPRMIPSSMLENGWTHGDSNNGLILRRINVEVIFVSNYVGGTTTLENTNATNIRFLTLPDGFRKLPSANYSTVGFARVSSTNAVLLTDPAHGMAVSAGSVKGYTTFNVNWTTTDPWPTVLPGTAV